MTRQRLAIFNSAPPAQVLGAGGSWYRVSNAANLAAGEPLQVDLMDEIGGWGVQASDFLRDLRAADDGQRPVVVNIASIGGDVWQGIAISNALRRMGDRVTACITSVAASIASVVAVGAHRVVMPENAMMMIHNPWAVVAGEADELREAADLLDKVKAALVATYRAKAPALSEDELAKMLSAETWLTAAEAHAMGLVDEVQPLLPIKASARLYAQCGRFKAAPAALLAALQPAADPAPASVVDPVEDPAPAAADPIALARLAASLCADKQLPVQAVSTVLAAGVASEADIRAGVERAVTIRDLCVTAKLPELALSLLASGLDVEAARARLFDKIVTNAGADLDNTPPDSPVRAPCWFACCRCLPKTPRCCGQPLR